MATFGKVIGGGMPVGAFGASTAIMAAWRPMVIPTRPGTLSGNPVAMAAGIATLDILEREAAWEQLEARGAQLEQLLAPVVGSAKFPLHLVRLGSLLWLSLHDEATLRRAGTLPPERATRASGNCFTPCWREASTCRRPPTRCIFVSLAHAKMTCSASPARWPKLWLSRAPDGHA